VKNSNITWLVGPRFIPLFENITLTKENLMLDLSIRFLLTKRLFIFPRKVFGGPRLP
jgi:hypothetical protein